MPGDVLFIRSFAFATPLRNDRYPAIDQTTIRTSSRSRDRPMRRFQLQRRRGLRTRGSRGVRPSRSGVFVPRWRLSFLDGTQARRPSGEMTIDVR